jgi:sterol desaturase/sphingolipid hydroxylase (fatty acid hydroxylase superfamily)
LKGFLRAALSLGFLGALLFLERKKPLRKTRESKLRRDGRNLAMAGLSALTIQAVETPVIRPLAKTVGEKGWGLLKLFRLPRPLETLAAIVLMDYTLYWWHVLTHRVALLWRFHAVHHVDLDMDASTAIRFHFGETAISVPYRAAQVLILGSTNDP